MTAPEAALNGRAAAARPRVAHELLLGLAVFALYALVAAIPREGRAQLARDNGRALFELERALHIDVEPSLNAWLAGQPVWRVLANYEYATTYVVTSFGLLGWIYLRRPESYRTARDSFVLVNLIGVAFFAAFPVMPPRLLPELGFVDTVLQGRTWGSWGHPLVEHADQFAALPSLHMAWALWVGVELARLAAFRWVQALNAVHIAATGYVIMATANHYLLDAVAAVPLVWIAVRLADGRHRALGRRVPAADAFFLAVESPAAPQQVGGLVLLDTSRAPVRRDDIVRLVDGRLAELPRFRQRLSRPSRWRRPRWEDHPAVDWDWHVVERDVTGPDGRPAGERRLHALVAEAQCEPLPRDRPLWRFLVVHGAVPDRTAVIFLMHHVVADGVGVVAQTLRLMEPPPAPAPPPARARGHRLRTAAAITVGLWRLATDLPRGVALPSGGTPRRRFGAVRVPLPSAREAARRHGARVTDVVLCAVAGGLSRVAPCLRDCAPPARGGPARADTCRVAVPLMMRGPGTPAEGNHTAAVMVDLPVGEQPEAERLAAIAARSGRLYDGARALAARFVMRRAAQLLPPPLHARFARAVYGQPFFQGIVSNFPGPDLPLRMAGAPLAGVAPILPLPPGVPLVVGALGWNGELGFGVSVDAALVDDPDLLTTAMLEVLAELREGDEEERRG